MHGVIWLPDMNSYNKYVYFSETDAFKYRRNIQNFDTSGSLKKIVFQVQSFHCIHILYL